MKACKKPYEKMWSAYGTWFQNYFAVRAATDLMGDGVMGDTVL